MWKRLRGLGRRSRRAPVESRDGCPCVPAAEAGAGARRVPSQSRQRPGLDLAAAHSRGACPGRRLQRRVQFHPFHAARGGGSESPERDGAREGAWTGPFGGAGVPCSTRGQAADGTDGRPGRRRVRGRRRAVKRSARRCAPLRTRSSPRGPCRATTAPCWILRSARRSAARARSAQRDACSALPAPPVRPRAVWTHDRGTTSDSVRDYWTAGAPTGARRKRGVDDGEPCSGEKSMDPHLARGALEGLLSCRRFFARAQSKLPYIPVVLSRRTEGKGNRSRRDGRGVCWRSSTRRRAR